jgi:hypothetical protein
MATEADSVAVLNSHESKETVLESLCSELHPSLNGGMNMQKLKKVMGVTKPVWWFCPQGPDHHWQETIDARITNPKKTGCPFCRGERISSTNMFKVLKPELTTEWHPTKNPPELGTPKEISPLSLISVWWSCSKVPGHEWRARVKDRTRGAGCPLCAANLPTSAAESVEGEAVVTKEGESKAVAETTKKLSAWEKKQEKLRSRGIRF